MSFIVFTPEDIQTQLAQRAKSVRLSRNLTQAVLAKKAGVSLSSLKRFEQTGEASLALLTHIAFALEVERDFNALFQERTPDSLEQLMNHSKRKRARGGGR